MEKWINFYEPFIGTKEQTTQFVNDLEQLDLASPVHRSKILMHQVQRLITLADDINIIRPGNDSLRLLFLIICAENAMKLFCNYKKDGQSKFFTQEFFKKFTSNEDRAAIESKFTTLDRNSLDLPKIIDLLYTVRCDVVHEGHFWGFNFSDGRPWVMNAKPYMRVAMSYVEFRAIIIRSALNALSLLKAEP